MAPDLRKALWHRVRLVAPGAASGLLLFISDFPVHAWPLQIVALVPLLAGLRIEKSGIRSGAVMGFWTGFFYAVPLLFCLRFPLLMGAGLAVYQILLWTLLAALAVRILRWRAPLDALGVASAAVAIEWFNVSVIPVWGTAQSFVRVWSACPWCVQFVSLFGMTGLVFVLVSVQALAVSLFVRPRGRVASLVALACTLLPVILLNTVVAPGAPAGSIRVAAVGWTFEDLRRIGGPASTGAPLDFFEGLVERAAGKGAKLIVTPETGLWLSEEERVPVLRMLGRFAKQRGVHLAVGYFDEERNDNRIAFIDAGGSLRGEYVKTHLIPLFENYRRGDGTPFVQDLEGVSLGSMICQDDNFTGLARSYGRLGVQVMAVPTNDWLSVKDYHLENALFRAVENRYAVVRAASNGISAIVTARGEVLARMDPFEEGPGVVVADLPLYAGGTFYSRAGDWWVVVCFAVLLAGGIATVFGARRRNGGPESPSSATS